jgi:hypothetical protein
MTHTQWAISSLGLCLVPSPNDLYLSPTPGYDSNREKHSGFRLCRDFHASRISPLKPSRTRPIGRAWFTESQP